MDDRLQANSIGRWHAAVEQQEGDGISWCIYVGSLRPPTDSSVSGSPGLEKLIPGGHRGKSWHVTLISDDFDSQDPDIAICDSERGITMERPQIAPPEATEIPPEFAETNAFYAELGRQAREEPQVALGVFSELIESDDRDERHKAACAIHLSVLADRQIGLAMWDRLLGDADWNVRGTAYEILLDVFDPRWDDENEGVELSPAEAAALAQTHYEADAAYESVRIGDRTTGNP